VNKKLECRYCELGHSWGDGPGKTNVGIGPQASLDDQSFLRVYVYLCRHERVVAVKNIFSASDSFSFEWYLFLTVPSLIYIC